MIDGLFFVGNFGYTIVALVALLGRQKTPVSMCVGVVALDILFLVGYVMLGLMATIAIGAVHLVVWTALLIQAMRKEG